MLTYKRLILGICCVLCGSASLVEARRLIHSENIEQDIWENIFDRAHELEPPAPHVKSRSFPKPKGKTTLKKKDDGNTFSTLPSSQRPSIAPTRSPVLVKVPDEDEDEDEDIMDVETSIPAVYPSYAPTYQPNLSLSSSPVESNRDLPSAPLLDFQITLSSQSSSTSVDIHQLEQSMETTLRLGIVLLDVKEIQFSTTPAQADSMTYTFSDGSAILKDNESSEFLQAQQIELLSDISFVESALQQEMKDPTIRVDDIQILQHNVLLPSAEMIYTADSDRNGMRIVIALIVCLIAFSLAAVVCYRRYKIIKR